MSSLANVSAEYCLPVFLPSATLIRRLFPAFLSFVSKKENRTVGDPVRAIPLSRLLDLFASSSAVCVRVTLKCVYDCVCVCVFVSVREKEWWISMDRWGCVYEIDGYMCV